MMTEKQMMNTREVAEYFGVEFGTVQKWRHLKKGPPFTVVSPICVLYKLKDILKWEKTRVGKFGRPIEKNGK